MNQDLKVQIERFESLDPLYHVNSWQPGSTKLFRAVETEGPTGGEKNLSDNLPAYSMLEWLNGFITAYDICMVVFGGQDE